MNRPALLVAAEDEQPRVSGSALAACSRRGTGALPYLEAVPGPRLLETKPSKATGSFDKVSDKGPITHFGTSSM